MNDSKPSPAAASGKRSLILAGGGMRVAYQAGVIRALAEAGLGFFHADGSSGGTMNLAMMLSGLSPAEMCDRWKKLNVRDFVTFMPLGDYLDATNLPALGSAEGIREHVFPQLGINVERIRNATQPVGTFNVCNYTEKTLEVIPNDLVDLDTLVAAISLPIFMPAVPIRGSLYLDSVWIQDAHCMEGVRRGAEEIWLVWCIGNIGQYHSGLFNQYVHMIEIAAHGALGREFAAIKEVNQRIERGESPFGQTRPIRLHLVKPEYPLPLDPALYLGRIDTATLIDQGYRDACNYLRHKRPEGAPWEISQTRMREPAIGIAFREMMSGYFSLGETEPERGEVKGRTQDTKLTMRASVEIQDLDRFIKDPDHVGGITGEIDFPSLGKGLPSKIGVFNLFSPSGRADLKYMVYELGFEAGGKDFYLAGKKDVSEDPGHEMWKDTTTLFTTLHEGRNASGPVVGAGILHLSLLGLLKMVPTMTVRNAQTLGEKTSALMKFGRFFSEKLYDTYLKSAPTG